MSEMVERVARAIREGRQCGTEQEPLTVPCPFCLWEAHETDGSETGCIWLARAAIAAMREPPASAVFGAIPIIVKLADAAPQGMLSYEAAASIARELWRAMIDAGAAGGVLDTPEGAKRLFDRALALAAARKASPDPSHN